LQRSPLPDIDVPHRENHDEDDHLDDEQSGELLLLPEGHGPGDHEDRLDVEDDEQHGHEIELDREPLPGIAQHRHAGLIGRDLDGGAAEVREQVGNAEHQDRVRDDEHDQNQDRDVRLKHGPRLS
jgi:hypothetical protein